MLVGSSSLAMGRSTSHTFPGSYQVGSRPAPKARIVAGAEQGAEVKAKDKDGATPRDVAKDPRIIQLLNGR